MVNEFWLSAVYSEGVRMGLFEEITNELSDAFDNDLADAVGSFEGKRAVKDNYDPVTGLSNNTEINYKGRGVFGSYSAMLIDGKSILAADKKLTALQAEVTAIPQINDNINGYKVISVSKDPVSVSWIIQLRA